MYAEDDQGNVILTLKRQDYMNLLLVMGYATGAASKDGEEDTEKTLVSSFLRLANVINEGNPGWVPYKLDD